MNKEMLAKMLSSKTELNENELKERLNFKKMLGKQEEQVNSSNHIKSLLGNKKTEETNSDLSLNDLQQYLTIKFGNLNKHIKILQSDNQELKTLLAKPKKYEINFLNKKILSFYLIGLIVSNTLMYNLNKEKAQKQVQINKTPQAKIAKSTPVIAKKESKNLYYSQKFINLRSEASSKAKKLLTLPPNSVFEVTDKKYGWFKLTYQDHIKGKTITAWAYGESIAKVKDINASI